MVYITDMHKGIHLGTLLLALAVGTWAQTTWTIRNSGTTKTLRTVAWNGSVLVTTGDAGALLSSTDGGVTWKPSTGSPLTYSLIWTGSQFVETAGYSPDGATWYSSPKPLLDNFTALVNTPLPFSQGADSASPQPGEAVALGPPFGNAGLVGVSHDG